MQGKHRKDVRKVAMHLKAYRLTGLVSMGLVGKGRGGSGGERAAPVEFDASAECPEASCSPDWGGPASRPAVDRPELCLAMPRGHGSARPRSGSGPCAAT